MRSILRGPRRVHRLRAGTAPDLRVADRTYGAEPGQVAGVGVGGHDLRAVGPVPDDRNGPGVDGDPLEEVEAHAERVRQDGLDDVAVRDGHPRCPGAVLPL